MERPHSEGKQHQSQSSRARSVHSNALQTKDSASICTNDIIPKKKTNRFYNDADDTLEKPNHYTIVMGHFNAQIGKRTKPMETATGKCGIKKRKRQQLDKAGIIKTVQNHEYHVPEERRGEMDMEKPNRVTSAEIDYILRNRAYIVTDVTVINQINKSRCRTNWTKEDRIPTRIEKPIPDTTRTR